MRVPTAPIITLSRKDSFRCGDMKALKGRCELFRALAGDMMATVLKYSPSFILLANYGKPDYQASATVISDLTG